MQVGKLSPSTDSNRLRWYFKMQFLCRESEEEDPWIASDWINLDFCMQKPSFIGHEWGSCLIFEGVLPQTLFSNRASEEEDNLDGIQVTRFDQFGFFVFGCTRIESWLLKKKLRAKFRKKWELLKKSEYNKLSCAIPLRRERKFKAPAPQMQVDFG